MVAIGVSALGVQNVVLTWRRQKLKKFNPKAIYVLFLLEKGSFNLDEIDKTCNDLGIDDVSYVADIDNENKMEIIGIR